MHIKYDVKSQRPFYYVSKKDFADIQLSEIPLHYGNITLFAAQHDNIGTVALMKNTDIPVLFRGVTIKEIMKKAAEQGLSSQNYSEFQNELSVTFDDGGGHFYAILQNSTNYVYSDFYPHGNSKNYVKAMVNYFFPQKCQLKHHNHKNKDKLNELRIHSGSPLISNNFLTQDHKDLYLSQFADLKKPQQGIQTIRFKLSDEQYAKGLLAITDLHNQCETGEVRYNVLFTNEKDIENCFTSINRIVRAIDIDTPYMKFFLDYQLLNTDDSKATYFYIYKYQNEFSAYDKFHYFDQRLNISDYLYKGAVAILTAAIEFQAIKYLGAPTLYTAPYAALLGNILQLVQNTDKPNHEFGSSNRCKVDPYYVIVPCTYDSYYPNPIGANSPSYSYSVCHQDSNPFKICLLDRQGIHQDAYINKNGNYEIKKPFSVPSNPDFPEIMCKEECILEYQRIDMDQEVDRLLGVVAEL